MGIRAKEGERRMIDFKRIRTVIADALSKYAACPVVLANQIAHIPRHPYISFTVTTPVGANNGTYGAYEDGIYRKPINQIWSFTAQSGAPDEAQELALKAHNYFDYVGVTSLVESGIVVSRLGDITGRDSLLSVNYEYRCGFDVTFGLMDEIDSRELDEGEIKTTDIRVNKEGG